MHLGCRPSPYIGSDCISMCRLVLHRPALNSIKTPSAAQVFQKSSVRIKYVVLPTTPCFSDIGERRMEIARSQEERGLLRSKCGDLELAGQLRVEVGHAGQEDAQVDAAGPGWPHGRNHLTAGGHQLQAPCVHGRRLRAPCSSHSIHDLPSQRQESRQLATTDVHSPMSQSTQSPPVQVLRGIHLLLLSCSKHNKYRANT
jgi:hypothetical protein